MRVLLLQTQLSHLWCTRKKRSVEVALELIPQHLLHHRPAPAGPVEEVTFGVTETPEIPINLDEPVSSPTPPGWRISWRKAREPYAKAPSPSGALKTPLLRSAPNGRTVAGPPRRHLGQARSSTTCSVTRARTRGVITWRLPRTLPDQRDLAVGAIPPGGWAPPVAAQRSPCDRRRTILLGFGGQLPSLLSHSWVSAD